MRSSTCDTEIIASHRIVVSLQFQITKFINSLECLFADIDASGCACRFSATGQIHCIPEETIAWHAITNNTGNNFAWMNSNGNLLLYVWQCVCAGEWVKQADERINIIIIIISSIAVRSAPATIVLSMKLSKRHPTKFPSRAIRASEWHRGQRRSGKWTKMKNTRQWRNIYMRE